MKRKPEDSLDELSKVVLPFGKHRGCTFDETPLGYLDWLSGQDFVYGELRKCLTAYLTHPTIKRELDQLETQEE